MSLSFSEQEIQQIFGSEAAEDENIDRLRSYYFKSKTYEEVNSDLPLRILVGHKGIGKSALFQVSMAEDEDQNKLSILIKPDDIIDLGEENRDFLKVIRSWKNGLNEIIAEKALCSLGNTSGSWKERLSGYGGKLLNFLQDSINNPDILNVNPARKSIVTYFSKKNSIQVYIDDLDRGWEGTKEGVRRISALLNAVRDLSNENSGLNFKISLRSDVYYLVRTSDESTDKIEGSVIWYSWTNHEIFVMLVKRVETFFGNEVNELTLIGTNQDILAKRLNGIFEERFQGRGHWNNAPMHQVILSLLRQRPRDLVKLCSLAARNTRRRHGSIIDTTDLEGSFEEYSQGRLQDTVNEYRSELPDIERLLLAMKPSKKEKKASLSYLYTTDQLLKKINDIQSQGAFKFSSGATASTKDLAAFLYKVNFLTARKDIGDHIDRKYFENNRYLANRFVDFGYDWEVHPAFRWALQPDDFREVLANL